ncbi:MAG: HAD-IB family hydrolase [Acidimicrobiales bacterium]|jgi:HAD superfamily hydrolase (TIGR01490 family)|nr:HAD-IB family hydrolase [Acidimicrobiales bacterium]
MPAAFFDLDKTVIATPSMVAFGGPLRRAGMINRRLMLRALWSGIVFHYLGADEERMRRFRESALRVTKGWDQALVRGLVADTLIDVVEPIVYDEALTLMRRHQSAGHRVVLISASPEEIVVPLGDYLGVDETIGSRARIDAGGRYTGEVEYYAYGPYKADAVEEIARRDGLDLAECWAYSDSATDLPLLRTVGHPVAVNPDRALARVARAEGWEVRQFRNGVPLGERIPRPAPGRIALGASVLVGTILGAATGRWLLGRRRAAHAPAARTTLGVVPGWVRTAVSAGPGGVRRPAAS